MENPLRSKDLDLVTDQFGPNSLDELTKLLSEQSPTETEVKTNNIQTRFFNGRIMRTYSVEMRIRKRPFFVEIFDAVLDGQPPSVLTSYVQQGKKWELDLWVPSREAVVALRLCFRQPEGISRLNGVRLNRFIKENRGKISNRNVGRIIEVWGKAELARSNLMQLKRLHNQEIIGGEQILRSIR